MKDYYFYNWYYVFAMPDRRQFITGIAAVSTVGIAGCSDTEEEADPEENVIDDLSNQ